MDPKTQDSKYVMVAHNHVATKVPGYLYQALAKLLAGTPVRPVGEDTCHVTTFYSKVPLNTFNPDPEKEFVAQVEGSKIWYDPYLGVTNLIVILMSPALLERHEMLTTKFGGVDAYQKYVPHLAIAYDIPAFTHTRKSFMNAFIDYVENYLKGETITLTGEYLESTSGLAKSLGKPTSSQPQ